MSDCTVKGCPDPRNEAEWHLRPCLHIEGVEHAEGGHHHHWPKQSQGGTEIVGFPCAFCHDRIDNGSWGNKVENINGERHWFVWDIHGECLIDKVIGQVDGGVETAMQVAGVEPPAVTVATDTEAPTLPTVVEVAYNKTSLDIPENMPEEEWTALMGSLQQMVDSVPWWVGDALAFGERVYGETYAQAVEATGMKVERLKNYVWVASHVEKSIRIDNLSWTHHYQVAALLPERQAMLLQRAKDEGMTVEELKRLVRHESIQALTSSESNEWYTPRRYIEAIREVLGEIDLDPASHALADKIVKAKQYYDLEIDGLKEYWEGRVFLNPPYGDLVGSFIEKLTREYDAGRVTEAIALVNAHCTDTSWFQLLWPHVLCFTDHRINFYKSEDMTPATGSTHGNVFIYLGPNEGKFAGVFAQFGTVVKRFGNP